MKMEEKIKAEEIDRRENLFNKILQKPNMKGKMKWFNSTLSNDLLSPTIFLKYKYRAGVQMLKKGKYELSKLLESKNMFKPINPVIRNLVETIKKIIIRYKFIILFDL